jgi:aminoglycoside/choline kinase family phosphotransferase
MTPLPTELSPAIRSGLERVVTQQLHWPRGPIAITSLPGDASNRRYFRLESGGDAPLPLTTPIADDPARRDTIGTNHHTAILMQLAEPEAFKASEEAVSATAGPPSELPFLNIWRHLHGRGLRVPELYHYDQDGGWLLLQDVGDRLLSHAVRDQPTETVRALYRQAIEELVRIQTIASEPPDHRCLAFGRCFDEALFMWEFDHFIEYGIEARRGTPLPPPHRQALRAAFGPIAAELAAQPRGFTHRDYHSRNLMLHQNQLWVIDFQDALLGPPSYDLASLLRDSYIELSETLITNLIDDYHQAGARVGRPVPDRSSFRRLFDLTSIQRNLKAAGRFVYIAQVKNNPNFLPAIPRTLGYVRANLQRYAELAPLAELLVPLVPELSTAGSPAPPSPIRS